MKVQQRVAPKKWEIWWVDQVLARAATSPYHQPGDPSDKDRMYLVVADPLDSNRITCCPLQDVGSGIGITEVELPENYRGRVTSKSCKIICNEIYTFPKDYFYKRMGFLDRKKQEDVQTALINFLELA